jgi:hypothetical protein
MKSTFWTELSSFWRGIVCGLQVTSATMILINDSQFSRSFPSYLVINLYATERYVCLARLRSFSVSPVSLRRFEKPCIKLSPSLEERTSIVGVEDRESDGVYSESGVSVKVLEVPSIDAFRR